MAMTTSIYRLPECVDIASAPERASLGILLAALHAVDGALHAVHPTLLFDDFIEPNRPKTLILARRITNCCDKLARLIDKYDRAVEDAVGGCYDFDDNPF